MIDFVFDTFNVELWKAVINDVSGVKVDSPSYPFFNLTLRILHLFTSFPLSLLYLTISAFQLVFWVVMLAFNF